MENRLKERLTGAAILVALIVLLVPEMFRGHSAELAGSAAGSAEGPPVRSYTIDLSNSATGSAPMRSSTAEAASAAAAIEAAPSNTPSKPLAQASAAALPNAATVPSATPSPKVMASAKLVPPPKVVASAKLTPSPKVVASANVAARTDRARTDPPAEARSSEGDGPGAQSGWSVQLGLFAQRENAERLMHAAQQKGFAARIAQPDAKGRYRVHVAGLADRAAAQSLLLRLKAQGLPASVVAP